MLEIALEFNWRVGRATRLNLPRTLDLCDNISKRHKYIDQTACLLIAFRTIGHDVNGIRNAHIRAFYPIKSRKFIRQNNQRGGEEKIDDCWIAAR